MSRRVGHRELDQINPGQRFILNTAKRSSRRLKAVVKFRRKGPGPVLMVEIVSMIILGDDAIFSVGDVISARPSELFYLE